MEMQRGLDLDIIGKEVDQRLDTVEKSSKRELNNFKKFILRGNVVDLAVGIVIGAAFSAVVTSLVSDLITPLIGLFGNFSFPAWTLSVGNSHFLIGHFSNAVLSFLILAAVIYFFVVKPINLLTHLYEEKVGVVITAECPFCKNPVSPTATRCGHCTSELPPVELEADTE